MPPAREAHNGRRCSGSETCATPRAPRPTEHDGAAAPSGPRRHGGDNAWMLDAASDCSESGAAASTTQRDAPAHQVVDACRRSGIQVTALHDYWGGQGEENGIVFGFGCHDDDTLDWAVNEIKYCVSCL